MKARIDKVDKSKYRGLLGSILSFYHKQRKYPNQTAQDILNDYVKHKPTKTEKYKRIIEKYQIKLIYNLKRKMKRRARRRNESKN